MKTYSDFRYCAAFLLALYIFAAGSVSASDNSDFSPKIGPFVRKAIRNASLQRQADSPMKIIIVTDTPHLENLPETHIRLLKERIGALGGSIGNHAYNKVQAWIPAEKIEELAAYPDIKMIQTPVAPSVSGTVSEGLSVVGADGWHNRGFTGKGVKVGVVDVGFYGYSSLLGKELPAKVSVKKMGSSYDFLSVEHGAACAEIVYDLAPDASMYLVNAGDYDVDFHTAVSWLESQGVNVVSSSIGINFSILCGLLYEIVYGSRWSSSYYSMQLEYFNEIKDQWNETINHAVSQGITWVQAAGNEGEKRWKSMFVDSDGDGYLNFTSDQNSNEIELPSRYSFGNEVYVLLAWGDQESTTDDFNLYITDNSGKTVAQSTIRQAEIPDFSMEVCKFTPVSGKKYFVKVQNYNASPQVVTLNIGVDDFAKFNIFLPSGTVKMNPPADNPNVITAGAVSYASPDTIETYSSQGPNADDIIKPDVVAPDGVSTSTYGTEGFSGTSAAAPYAAGVSVLVKQAHPDYTPVQIRSYLEQYALDLGEPGKDNVYGSGLVRLPESECISVSDDLKLNFCVNYRNESFTAALAYSPSANDPSGMYWKLNPSSLVRTSNGGNCISVGDNLKVSVCAQYRGTAYEVTLDYDPARSTASEMYWKLNPTSFRKK